MYDTYLFDKDQVFIPAYYDGGVWQGGDYDPSCFFGKHKIDRKTETEHLHGRFNKERPIGDIKVYSYWLSWSITTNQRVRRANCWVNIMVNDKTESVDISPPIIRNSASVMKRIDEWMPILCNAYADFVKELQKYRVEEKK